MNTAYLLIGGNMGNREAYLKEAENLLTTLCGSITKTSACYETAAWGNTDQPAYLNQAIELKTTLNARQLIRKILKIEKSMGRMRSIKYGPRTIDIDILLFNFDIYNYTFLKVPHPELPNRRFVLEPLSEIAANVVHPIFNKTIMQLLSECPDQLKVKKYS